MQQLLLLAARVLILVLLAVTLADLQLSTRNLPAHTTERSGHHHVIVLDASYSMGLIDQGVPRFERARQKAIELAQHSGPDHAFSLIWMGAPVRAVIGRPSFEANAVVEALQQMQCGHGGADVEQTIELVDSLVRQARQDHPALDSCSVDWLTDLGRNSWECVEKEAVARRLRRCPKSRR